MSHANAALTPRQRLRLARQIVDDGWSISAAADYFRVSYPTAAKWAKRYVELGADGMAGRSSRPHSHPNQTPQLAVKKIVHLRIKKRLGPVQIAGRLGMPSSTAHAVLVRCMLNRLSHVDVRTGEPARRYEHETPGSLIHVDVKKLGNIPIGGGWRFVGRAQGNRNRAATEPNRRKGKNRDPLLGHAFIHTVIDDHSRVAYAEIHNDERADTAISVLRRAVSWFADHGVTVERVLSDNGPAYRSHAWRHACNDLEITPNSPVPAAPRPTARSNASTAPSPTDGLTRSYNSESTRRAALPAWLHFYNHHRPHTAIGKLPPISRLNNLPGHYI